jgi:hypothetical protein
LGLFPWLGLAYRQLHSPLKPEPCDLAAPVDAQLLLLQNAMYVVLDRRGTEAQQLGDPFVEQIAGDQRGNLFAFAVSAHWRAGVVTVTNNSNSRDLV